jgi:hypothetical protein
VIEGLAWRPVGVGTRHEAKCRTASTGRRPRLTER